MGEMNKAVGTGGVVGRGAPPMARARSREIGRKGSQRAEREEEELKQH